MIMTRDNRRRQFSLTLMVALAAWLSGHPLCAQHSARLPSETIAAFSILDFQDWSQHWNSTGLAKYLSNDGVAHVIRQVRDQADGDLFWQTVFELDSFSEFVDGQITIAVIEFNSSPELAAIVDVADQPAAQKWLQSTQERHRATGGTSAESETAGRNILSLVHDSGGQSTRLHLCQFDSLLIACSSDELMNDLFSESRVGGLHQLSEFKLTVAKSQNDLPEPMFWWYCRPLPLLKWIEDSQTTDSESLSNYELAMKEGFAALRAAGGCGSFADSPSAFSSVGYVVADRPFERGMRLLSMDNTAQPNLPKWLGGSTAWAFVNLQVSQFPKHYSTLFDTLYGEGEEGVFDLVLEDLKTDPDGPQVDLQSELFEQLAGPVFIAAQHEDSSSSQIICVPIVDSGRVANAVSLFFQGDDRADKISVDYDAWNVLPLEEMDVGIRQPYVIAVRDECLILAGDIETIDKFIDASVVEPGNVKPATAADSRRDELCLRYFADAQAIARTKHEQIRIGEVDGLLGALLQRLELAEALKSAGREKLPDFSEVAENLAGQISVAAKTTDTGWKLWVESK